MEATNRNISQTIATRRAHEKGHKRNVHCCHVIVVPSREKPACPSTCPSVVHSHSRAAICGQSPTWSHLCSTRNRPPNCLHFEIDSWVVQKAMHNALWPYRCAPASRAQHATYCSRTRAGTGTGKPVGDAWTSTIIAISAISKAQNNRSYVTQIWPK